MAQQKISDKFAILVEHLRNKNSDEAIRLVTAEPQLLQFIDESGRLALHWAASYGCLSFVEYAVRSDENLITKVDDSSWTSLMIASSAGHFEIVKYLLSFSLTDVNHRYF